jgi:hypothetical protein
MKVLLLDHHSYGETYLFDESTNLLNIPLVVSELEWIGENYPEERDEFVADVEAGNGGHIEERFTIYLEEVKHVE